MKYVAQYSTTFDVTWDSVDIVVWSMIEQFTALLCGSLPVLRHLLASLVPAACSSVREVLRHSRHNSGAPHFEHSADMGLDQEMSCPGGMSEPAMLDRGRIRVTTTIQWASWFDDGCDDGRQRPQQPPPAYSKN